MVFPSPKLRLYDRPTSELVAPTELRTFKSLLPGRGFQCLISGQEMMTGGTIPAGDQGRGELQGISRPKPMDPNQPFCQFAEKITGLNLNPGIGERFQSVSDSFLIRFIKLVAQFPSGQSGLNFHGGGPPNHHPGIFLQLLEADSRVDFLPKEWADGGGIPKVQRACLRSSRMASVRLGPCPAGILRNAARSSLARGALASPWARQRRISSGHPEESTGSRIATGLLWSVIITDCPAFTFSR